VNQIPSISSLIEDLTGKDHAIKVRAIPAAIAGLCLPFFPVPALAVLLVIVGDAMAEPAQKAIDRQYPALPPGKERKAIAPNLKIAFEDEESTPDPWQRQSPKAKAEPVEEETASEPTEPTRPQASSFRDRRIDWSMGSLERFVAKVPTMGLPLDAVDDDPEEAERLCLEYCGRFERTAYKKNSKGSSGVPYLAWYVFGLTEGEEDYAIAADYCEAFLIHLTSPHRLSARPAEKISHFEEW